MKKSDAAIAQARRGEGKGEGESGGRRAGRGEGGQLPIAVGASGQQPIPTGADKRQPSPAGAGEARPGVAGTGNQLPTPVGAAEQRDSSAAHEVRERRASEATQEVREQRASAATDEVRERRASSGAHEARPFPAGAGEPRLEPAGAEARRPIPVGAAFARRKAFIPYLMAGDPGIDETRSFMLALAGAGADAIELGSPFSDPVAEGETIQRANVRALASGTDLGRVFELADSVRGALGIPLLLMLYANPVLNYGYERFFRRCAQAGVGGVIMPDMPFEEQGEVLPFASACGVDVISLIAPTSAGRAAKIAKAARGYIYLVSSMGVTGMRREITADLSGIVGTIRENTAIPVAAGFGVHTPEQAKALARGADGVIVGSAIVDIIERFGASSAQRLAEYAASIRAALDEPRNAD